MVDDLLRERVEHVSKVIRAHDVHSKGEEVTATVAAVAVPHLPFRVHGETRRPLIVAR